MRMLSAGALLVVIIGAINWMLVGLARLDLVATATGDRFGRTNALSSAVYVAVGLAGLGLIPMLVSRLTKGGEERGEATTGEGSSLAIAE